MVVADGVEIEIPTELYDILKEVSEKGGLSIEEWVHEAITLYLDKDE